MNDEINEIIPRFKIFDVVLNIEKEVAIGGMHVSTPGWKSFGLKNRSIFLKSFSGLKVSAKYEYFIGFYKKIL